MDPKEYKHSLYCESRKATGCSQNDWARLFNQMPITGVKHRQKGQHIISEKEAGQRGISLAECLTAQLLRFMALQGYDVANIEFDEKGTLLDVPKTKTKI